jgi:hypothetical protein
MDAKLMEEVLNELFPRLEGLETQSRAVMEFLKERGIASDQDLAPFLEQAANASSVRWRATRLRVNHLLAGAMKAVEASQKRDREVTESKAETKTEMKSDGEASQKVPEGHRDSGEHSARAATEVAEAGVDQSPDNGRKRNKEDGRRETEASEASRPGGNDAA